MLFYLYYNLLYKKCLLKIKITKIKKIFFLIKLNL